MNIAEFDKRIELYAPVYEDDGMGGYINKPPVLQATVWAKFLKPKFWETNVAGGIASAITQGIVIRTRSDIETNWIVRFKSQDYQLLHIDYSDAETLTLTCQAVVWNG